MNTETGRLTSSDGMDLFWRRHGPRDAHRATLLFVHGLAEHSGRYVHVLERFSREGFDCWAFDYRCHGHSPGLRVHIDEFDQFAGDLRAAHRMVRETCSELPLFLVGHSQGGLLVLHHTLSGEEGLDGIVVSSPFLGIHPDSKPAAPVHMVANILSTFAPKLMFSKVAQPTLLSHDPRIPEAYVADPLVSSKVSARWFTEIVKAQAWSREHAHRLSVPALVMQSGDDRLADPAATRAWAKAAPEDLVDFVEWPGFYHEMFNEPEKEQVFERMEAWLEGRIEALEA
jgi:lysophospholipase